MPTPKTPDPAPSYLCVEFRAKRAIRSERLCITIDVGFVAVRLVPPATTQGKSHLFATRVEPDHWLIFMRAFGHMISLSNEKRAIASRGVLLIGVSRDKRVCFIKCQGICNGAVMCPQIGFVHGRHDDLRIQYLPPTRALVLMLHADYTSLETPAREPSRHPDHGDC
jgi:hypothetical protein